MLPKHQRVLRLQKDDGGGGGYEMVKKSSIFTWHHIPACLTLWFFLELKGKQKPSSHSPPASMML